MNKQTIYGKDARQKMADGIEKISKAVCCTLGPAGRCVMISQSAVIDYGVHSLPIEISKDGYKVAMRFELQDHFEKAGILLVKEAAQKSVDQSGDGTTTTVLLLNAIVKKGIELVNSGSNPMELKRDLDKAIIDAIDQLKAIATPIRGDINKIRQIATISANNDPEIGNMIANAYEKIGDEGIIDLEAGQSVETEIKIADGYKWDKSWVSPLFINNKEKQICEFDNPFILLYSNRITHHTQMQRALELTMASGRPMLIVCEDAADEGLAFLAMNNIQQRIRCCVVKAPAFADQRREEMEDLALLTGGSYISDIRGINIKEIELENLGQAKKVIVTKEETIIIGGNGNKAEIENFVNELRMNLAQAKNEDEKAPIEKRIAKMKGGVAVIQVGAATETEMKEKLDRFDDSVRAVKAAISEGFIVGGGTALLRVKTKNEIIQSILEAPFIQICENAGVNVKDKLEQVKFAVNKNWGYNAKTDSIEDLIESGVIDPLKVLKCALINAASCAGSIITTECLIADTL